jgi:hypothetical protein
MILSDFLNLSGFMLSAVYVKKCSRVFSGLVLGFQCSKGNDLAGQVFQPLSMEHIFSSLKNSHFILNCN